LGTQINVSANDLVVNLSKYINSLDFDNSSKKLLVKELGDVTSSLSNEQYKQALVKLKVFMLEVKILKALTLTQDQTDTILKASLDISMAIKSDSQGKDRSWVDNKVETIIASINKFKASKITEDVYESIFNKIDELVDKIK
jgi:hypothetical protein